MKKGREAGKKRNATPQEGREALGHLEAPPPQKKLMVDQELPFNAERLKELIRDRFKKNPKRKPSKVPPADNLVYDMEENFGKADQYWFGDLQTARFGGGDDDDIDMDDDDEDEENEKENEEDDNGDHQDEEEKDDDDKNEEEKVQDEDKEEEDKEEDNDKKEKDKKQKFRVQDEEEEDREEEDKEKEDKEDDDKKEEDRKQIFRVLYRPKIVKKLVKRIERRLNREKEKQLKWGIMVKGPQGIGKSFSLVNLVLYLMSTGKYLVTFIPDCEGWRDHTSGLYDVICASIGTKPSEIGIKLSVRKNRTRFDLNQLIRFISDELDAISVKWVFVFDQINRLFLKPGCEGKKDVGALPFPFYMVKDVMYPGRIISIISASANNELAYKESHIGFDDLDHRASLSREETQALYKEQLNGLDMGNLHYLTGFVPLYLSDYFKTTESDYFDEVVRAVKFSLMNLHTQYGNSSVGTEKWKETVDVSVRMLLSTKLASRPNFYDRKFTYLSENIYPKALFPLVEVAFLEILWDNLIEFIDKNEVMLLEISKNTQVRGDVRGRIFELLVIWRLQQNEKQTKTKIQGLTIPSHKIVKVQTLPGKSTLPVLDKKKNSTRMWVPCAPNFAAVDVILELKSQVWGIQIHVSTHKDVLAKFSEMCDNAGWFKSHKKKFIWFISVRLLLSRRKQRTG